MNFICSRQWNGKKILSSVFGFFLIVISCEGQGIQPKNEASQKDTSFLHFIGRNPVPKKQALYVEWFGSAANLYSFNYERCIFMHKLESKKWVRYSLRVGINYYMEKYAVPLMVHFSTGIDYCFEAGAGWVPWLSDKKRVDGLAVFSGFRYQPERLGLMARFTITPTYLIQEQKHWRMIFGASFGWAF